MALPQQSEMTLDAFLKLPDEKPALEFADGMVSQKVPPEMDHSGLQWRICELINRITLPLKTACAVPELRTTFAGRSTVPDVIVVRWDAIPRRKRGRLGGPLETPPVIAFEIISPGQRTNALVRRCLWYIAHGVVVALLVDPEDESVLVFQRDAVPQALSGPDTIDLTAVIPDLRIPVTELFSVMEW